MMSTHESASTFLGERLRAFQNDPSHSGAPGGGSKLTSGECTRTFFFLQSRDRVLPSASRAGSESVGALKRCADVGVGPARIFRSWRSRTSSAIAAPVRVTV